MLTMKEVVETESELVRIADKGSIELRHDYHSGTWIANMLNKDRSLRFHTADEYGEGQYSVGLALRALLQKTKQ